MSIIKNSAKCTACGEEIESKHRHDFNVHYCKVEAQLRGNAEETFRFGVDGGRAYIRRVGEGFVDTSEYME